ncbi:essential MCU regulator, mitochondrial [Drosophila nasuta]|uniref:essential MCU regulator, mitochondrial n=1 Tax=Drosophila nasuta TaxID=42062 RepID=UPI00295E5955|nr:essential MCU regulator, mitochondrial [Drosophila nasuta]XP_060648010.1 essential MCU regulator, mitochondrial [Drosophila nasuta]XP_060648018.1 essential MCU regulator, mitochondrial [Drosophila nasuta]
MRRILAGHCAQTWSIRRWYNGSKRERHEGLGPQPFTDKHTIMGLAITIIPGISLGIYLGKHLAQFLELSEIFAPGDDSREDDD